MQNAWLPVRDRRAEALTQGFSSDQQNRIAKQPLNGPLHDPMRANAPTRPVLYERERVVRCEVCEPAHWRREDGGGELSV